jgi:sugar lactone lactonase YvrE
MAPERLTPQARVTCESQHLLRYLLVLSCLSHRYAYDIVFPEDIAGDPSLVNRSVFAMTDSGAPDGIKLDMSGNVYAGW